MHNIPAYLSIFLTILPHSSPAGRCHSQSGAVHLAVRCSLPVRARYSFPRPDPNLHLLARTARMGQNLDDHQERHHRYHCHRWPGGWNHHQFEGNRANLLRGRIDWRCGSTHWHWYPVMTKRCLQ